MKTNLYTKFMKQNSISMKRTPIKYVSGKTIWLEFINEVQLQNSCLSNFSQYFGGNLRNYPEIIIAIRIRACNANISKFNMRKTILPSSGNK